jgi:hypothetical protein
MFPKVSESRFGAGGKARETQALWPHRPLHRVNICRVMASLWVVVPALLLFAPGCNEDKIARLEKQNQELAAKNQELTAKLEATIRSANLDAQVKCAEQGRLVFNESGLKNKPLSNYTNHYNQKLNKCFVQFYSMTHEGNGPVIYKSAVDAFEGKQYAEYYWDNSRGKQAYEVKPSICDVTLPSGEKKVCGSDKEFDELLKVYMDN